MYILLIFNILFFLSCSVDLISKNVKFEMFDITGRLVYSKEEKLDNQAFYILDLPELTSGKYALRVTIDNNEPILLNVIKQNK